MTQPEPYNPLDKRNLGASVADAILKQKPVQLPPKLFNGAGVYAIYYTGGFDAYKLVSDENKDDRFNWPIYVGKAVPKGGRKGGLGLTHENVGTVMFGRLQEHARASASYRFAICRSRASRWSLFQPACLRFPARLPES